MAKNTVRRISRKRIVKSKKVIDNLLSKMEKLTSKGIEIREKIEKLGDVDAPTVKFRKKALDNELSVLESGICRVQFLMETEQQKLDDFIEKNNSLYGALSNG